MKKKELQLKHFVTGINDNIKQRFDHFEKNTIEPRSEKTGLRGFRPGPIQTGLCSHRRWLEP